jgi:hypothetical protein
MVDSVYQCGFVSYSGFITERMGSFASDSIVHDGSKPKFFCAVGVTEAEAKRKFHELSEGWCARPRGTEMVCERKESESLSAPRANPNLGQRIMLRILQWLI